MKKFVSLLICAILVLTMAACGASDNNGQTEAGKAENTAAALDIKALGEYVMNNVSFDEKLEEIDEQACKNIYGIDADCSVCSYSAGSRPERFAAFEAKNAEDLEAIRTAVNDYVKYLHDGYSDYGPDQVPKIDSAVIMEKGNVLIFCISADNAAAKEAISNFIG